jgi:hypothetical protein
VEAAPLDLAEWQRKRDIYHTGSMLQLATDPDLTVAVADLTPAYTNKYSGRGSFSHRTHRVTAFVRTLGFDPDDEVIIIHDRVQAARPELTKNWLLHSSEKPAVEDNRFTLGVGPANKPGRQGGRLRGRVLLPKDSRLTLMGGPGFEFFVDGVNYDNNGSVWDRVKQRPHLEPGAWRIQLSSVFEKKEDRFLVVLTPELLGDAKRFDIRLLEQGDRYGCEIVGAKRITRWWFDSLHDGPVVEVVARGNTLTRDLRVPRQPDMLAHSSLSSRLARLLGFSD